VRADDEFRLHATKIHVKWQQAAIPNDHPQRYYLPQSEGVLLHALDDRSRVCG
jgi:hypothetical protein